MIENQTHGFNMRERPDVQLRCYTMMAPVTSGMLHDTQQADIATDGMTQHKQRMVGTTGRMVSPQPHGEAVTGKDQGGREMCGEGWCK